MRTRILAVVAASTVAGCIWPECDECDPIAFLAGSSEALTFAPIADASPACDSHEIPPKIRRRWEQARCGAEAAHAVASSLSWADSSALSEGWTALADGTFACKWNAPIQPAAFASMSAFLDAPAEGEHSPSHAPADRPTGSSGELPEVRIPDVQRFDPFDPVLPPRPIHDRRFKPNPGEQIVGDLDSDSVEQLPVEIPRLPPLQVMGTTGTATTPQCSDASPIALLVPTASLGSGPVDLPTDFRTHVYAPNSYDPVFEGPASCTAFLVRQDLALTAAHCLPDYQARCSDESAPDWTLVFDYVEGTLSTQVRRKITAVVACGTSTVLSGDNPALEHGWALLRLDQPSDRCALPIAAPSAWAQCDAIYTIGYPLGHPQRRVGTADPQAPKAWILSAPDGNLGRGFKSTLDTIDGLSGAPVFTTAGELVAMHVAGGYAMIDDVRQCRILDMSEARCQYAVAIALGAVPDVVAAMPTMP